MLREKNINRVAGTGTWKNNKTNYVFDSHNNAIGFMKPFSFVAHNKNEKKTWIMHEYTLKSYPSPHDDHQGEWALCRIRRGSDKKNIKDDNNVEDDEPPLCKTADDQITLEKAFEINEDQYSNMQGANKRMRVSYPSVLFPQTTEVPTFDVGCSQKDNNHQYLPSNVAGGLPHHPQPQCEPQLPSVIQDDDVAFLQNYSSLQLQPDDHNIVAQQDCQSAYNDNGHEVLLFQPSSVGADVDPLQDHSGIQLMDTIFAGDDVNLSIEDYLSPPQPEYNGFIAAQQDYCQGALINDSEWCPSANFEPPLDQDEIDILKNFLADSNNIADNNAAVPPYEETYICQPAVF
ncbi:hypothetical protein FRX31_027466 [Thalictrum thalictroides]|uniref:NAC domain-containing protein n=1 Tax=Thalictrum thalictroides TaxID=46969 RepID=A0A7J6VDG4_THATH|nr:hypothetical protein FRX31_027466 [Thalictrum thalictroides]